MFSTAGSKAIKPATVARRAARLQRRSRVQCRYQSTAGYSSAASRYAPWVASSTAAVGVAATLFYASYNPKQLHAEAPPAPAELTFEKTKKRGDASKEEIRDSLSSQHVQVKKSWENPGVYAWGSNINRVAAPDSDDPTIRTPRRIPFFDNMLLRDIQLDRYHGAAIDEKGNLIQWGKGYSETDFTPRVTFSGKDLISITTSRDRIVGLSSSGKVYSIPASKADQASGPKPLQTTWVPFYKSPSKISYRRLNPELGWGEKVTAIRGGLEHVLLLTSSGRVFSAASSTEFFPSRGQLGIPALTWTTRPKGAYDMCHEITGLQGYTITKIATGDYHSLALDKVGRVFAFGDNSSGQLGFDFNAETLWIDSPARVDVQKLYAGTGQQPKVTDIAAGGSNSFFTVDATSVSPPGQGPRKNAGRVSVDTWACGLGIMGGLGNGKWQHMGRPSKLPSLSGLSEYDDATNSIVPIRLSHITVGSTHSAAVMKNVVNLNASSSASADTTLYGADVLLWGGNEFYQIGNGKRNNIATPTYIPPLDSAAEKEQGRKTDHRFQITPRHKVKVNGRNVTMAQEIECGRYVTAVYSKV